MICNGRPKIQLIQYRMKFLLRKTWLLNISKLVFTWTPMLNTQRETMSPQTIICRECQYCRQRQPKTASNWNPLGKFQTFLMSYEPTMRCKIHILFKTFITQNTWFSHYWVGNGTRGSARWFPFCGRRCCSPWWASSIWWRRARPSAARGWWRRWEESVSSMISCQNKLKKWEDYSGDAT